MASLKISVRGHSTAVILASSTSLVFLIASVVEYQSSFYHHWVRYQNLSLSMNQVVNQQKINNH